MAEGTEISWAEDTFNPWEGCQKVSSACDGCYAEARNLRYAGTGEAPNWGPGAPRRRTSVSNWNKPLKWEREQAALWEEYDRLVTSCSSEDPRPDRPEPRPRFVFCASLADVFDNAVPIEWRRDLFDLIRATPHLTWLLLTKRPGNIVSLWREAMLSDPKWLGEEWPRNAAIGCTVVTQEEADRDVPKLLAAKAALNPAFAFVSMEPLLGPVDLTQVWASMPGGGRTNALGPASLDWVITGGETDQGKHKARPSSPAWFRSLRDQCAAAGVAFHHKQNGEWGFCPDRSAVPDQVFRVGKKAAGRLLDGVTHDARPKVRS